MSAQIANLLVARRRATLPAFGLTLLGRQGNFFRQVGAFVFLEEQALHLCQLLDTFPSGEGTSAGTDSLLSLIWVSQVFGGERLRLKMSKFKTYLNRSIICAGSCHLRSRRRALPRTDLGARRLAAVCLVF